MPTANPSRTTDALEGHAAAGEPKYLLSFFHPGGVETVELGEGQTLVVGREEPADVRLPVQSVSRTHARVSRHAGLVQVEDLGSRNGTFVAGEPITTRLLQPGGAAQLGGVTLVLQCLPAGDTRSTPSTRPPACDPSGAVSPLRTLSSPRMQALHAMVERVAAADLPVLITGETGVGKELVATSLHALGRRKDGPFRAINCGAIPDSLLSSILFGHEKGAFTGAVQAAKGIFEQADGGTVFLDEVGELSSSIQVALLRVLETGRITRVGTDRERQLDVRVVCATHRDLDAMVHEGRFRADLLFRLNTLALEVPPLRERPEDIEALAQHFAQAAANRQGLAHRAFDEEFLARLRAYAWPGNVRELRNVVERAVVLATGERLTLADLPPRACADDRDEAGASAPEAASGVALDSDGCDGYRERVRDYEVRLITEALQRVGGSRARAAELLRLPLRTLSHKMKQYGM